MAEHIEKTRLIADLRYRFEYLSKFLNFTKDDIHALNSIAPIIFPRLPSLVETIYKKLYTYDILQQYFILRNDDFGSFSSNDDVDVSVLSAQTDFRKDMLSMYLKRVLVQTEWNDIFLQYLFQVGEIHFESDHFTPTNVDYIHINALLGFLEHLLIDILWTAENFDEKKKSTAIKALNKFFWIQNDFFTMHHEISIKQDLISPKTLGKPSKCLFQ